MRKRVYKERLTTIRKKKHEIRLRKNYLLHEQFSIQTKTDASTHTRAPIGTLQTDAHIRMNSMTK